MMRFKPQLALKLDNNQSIEAAFIATVNVIVIIEFL